MPSNKIKQKSMFSSNRIFIKFTVLSLVLPHLELIPGGGRDPVRAAAVARPRTPAPGLGPRGDAVLAAPERGGLAASAALGPRTPGSGQPVLAAAVPGGPAGAALVLGACEVTSHCPP